MIATCETSPLVARIDSHILSEILILKKQSCMDETNQHQHFNERPDHGGEDYRRIEPKDTDGHGYC